MLVNGSNGIGPIIATINSSVDLVSDWSVGLQMRPGARVPKCQIGEMEHPAGARSGARETCP
jgi:hypothetical protein